MTAALAWPLALGGLGAIVGSFFATLVVRWPEGRSVMRGRSRCDACGRPLAPVELVPLVSAALLRGQCRTCGVAIDPWHWRIEALTAAVGVAAGVAVPAPMAIAGCAFGWLLLTLGALDLRAFWLPDRLTVLLALAGFGAALAGVPPAIGARLIGAAAGSGSLWLVANGYRLIRRREGMGGGDPKLFGAIGAWLGWAMLPAVLLLASLIGLGAVAVVATTGRAVRRDMPVPFGTLLAIAAYPAWLVMITVAR